MRKATGEDRTIRSREPDIGRWKKYRGETASPDVLRTAPAVEENIARRLEPTVRVVIPVTAVEDPRAGPGAVWIPVLMEIDELVEGAEIHRPAGQTGVPHGNRSVPLRGLVKSARGTE